MLWNPLTYSNVGPSAIQTDYWVAEEDDDEDGITRVNFQEVITDWGSKGQATALLTNELLHSYQKLVYNIQAKYYFDLGIPIFD